MSGIESVCKGLLLEVQGLQIQKDFFLFALGEEYLGLIGK